MLRYPREGKEFALPPEGEDKKVALQSPCTGGYTHTHTHTHLPTSTPNILQAHIGEVTKEACSGRALVIGHKSPLPLARRFQAADCATTHGRMTKNGRARKLKWTGTATNPGSPTEPLELHAHRPVRHRFTVCVWTPSISVLEVHAAQSHIAQSRFHNALPGLGKSTFKNCRNPTREAVPEILQPRLSSPSCPGHRRQRGSVIVPWTPATHRARDEALEFAHAARAP